MFNRPERSGFILIELLVIIAIIAILAAILFPVFGKAREKVRQVQCLSNQRQLAMAMVIYVQEQVEKLPSTENWIAGVNVDPKMLLCPSATKTAKHIDYGYNTFLDGVSLATFTDSTRIFLTADAVQDAECPFPAPVICNVDEFNFRHDNGVICSFLDGHSIYLLRNPSTTIVVADTTESIDHTNLYLLVKQGLNLVDNLNVELVTKPNATAAEAALIAGKADVCVSRAAAAIAAIASGSPVKIIAQGMPQTAAVFVVPANSSIGLSSLAGKIIAAPSEISETVLTLQKTTGASFTVSPLIGNAAIQALENGSIDGAILEEPFVSESEVLKDAAGNPKYKDLFRDTTSPGCVLLARTAALSTPDNIQRFIHTIDTANDEFGAYLDAHAGNADELNEVVEKFADFPDAAVATGLHRLRINTHLDQAKLQALGDILKAKSLIPSNADLSSTALFADIFKGITW